MPDILKVSYNQTGKSTKQDKLGMREMQARAYAKRNAQYILLKAPPASGKSRALMFIALDKVHNQGLDKVIIAVPEMSIGGSFKDTELKKHGFFADWKVQPQYNLCLAAGNAGKVDKLLAFLRDDKAHYLVCTHATLRFAYENGFKSDMGLLRKTLLAIDEFHHTSAEDGNKLGAMLDDVMNNSSAHVVAMTGSYFRGDSVPILAPEAEARFEQVTYTYYEQLNGYKYLRSLGLGYHFYQGRYLSALREVLDLGKKTIVHIPNVNSMESTGLKLSEVDEILDTIGQVEAKDPETGIMTVKTESGKLLKVADLVSDDQMRANVLKYLRGIDNADQMDIIIALGMAKEGFDWPWCEHVLTIGYRASMTEVVQIIGRATRDCEGKTHAQFTNLIAQPDAEDEDVRNSVNNLLKAITLSLLMREVLAPNIRFRPRSTMGRDEKPKDGEIIIDDTDKPLSGRVKQILEEGGIQQIITELVSKPEVIAPAVVSDDKAKVVTDIEMPKIITQLFPDLPAAEVSTLNDIAKTQLVIQASGGLREDPAAFGQTGGMREEPVPFGPDGVFIHDLPENIFPNIFKNSDDSKNGEGSESNGNSEDNGDREPRSNKAFLRIGDKFIHVDELNIDLIDSVNPFQDAYAILSKSIDAPMLKTIQDHVTASKSTVTEEEAVLLWPNIKDFKRQFGVEPNLNSSDPYEKRLAEVLAFVRRKKAENLQVGQA